MTDSKRSGNSTFRSKLRGIKPAVIDKLPFVLRFSKHERGFSEPRTKF